MAIKQKCSQYTNILVGFWIVDIDQGVYIQEGFEVSRCQKSAKFLCFTQNWVIKSMSFFVYKNLPLSMLDYKWFQNFGLIWILKEIIKYLTKSYQGFSENS